MIYAINTEFHVLITSCQKKWCSAALASGQGQASRHVQDSHNNAPDLTKNCPSNLANLAA